MEPADIVLMRPDGSHLGKRKPPANGDSIARS
jgi:hypothetical protein